MCMLTAHLKSRNPGALPVRPYTYRVFAAESSRSSNIPTFLAAAVSVRARCVCLSLSLARACVCVVSSDSVPLLRPLSTLCTRTAQMSTALSTGLWWVGCGVLCSTAPQSVCAHCACAAHTHTTKTHTAESLCKRGTFFSTFWHTFFTVCSLTHDTTQARGPRRGAGCVGRARAGAPALEAR